MNEFPTFVFLSWRNDVQESKQKVKEFVSFVSENLPSTSSPLIMDMIVVANMTQSKFQTEMLM